MVTTEELYAKGRMYGDDFSYKACSKEEMTRLWNYHIEHENATPCYAITRGVSQKNRKMRYTKCTCRKSIRSKRISKKWVVLGSVGAEMEMEKNRKGDFG